MKLRWLRNQQGSILLFTTILVVPLMIIFGGLAMDLAYHGTVDDELQRAMDAAALAGAGKLGFDSSVFPTVRSFAQSYALSNRFRVGTINLGLNTGNDPNGNIVLGIWNAGTFTPSLDGTQVNAVRCQYSTTIPTSFLGLLGITNLPVGAQAIAIANPPATPPPPTCPMPIGLSSCPFTQGGVFTSQGCGAPVTFTTSSGKTSGPASTNTAAWVNLGGNSTPSASYLKTAVGNAATGSCSDPEPVAGTQIGAQNGLDDSVFQELATVFKAQFNASMSNPITVTNTNASGQTGTSYTGPGWEVYVPVISTPQCPPTSLTGSFTIAGWTKFVITQVISKSACVVNNPGDLNSAPFCSANTPKNALFGYYACGLIKSPPVPIPAPRAALATKIQLVR